MSHFSNQLRTLMEARKLTQVALSEKSGLSQASLSRCLSAEHVLRHPALNKLLKAFPRREDRAELLAARVRDSVPKSMRNKIDIFPTPDQGTAHQPDQQRQQRRRMPRQLREAFESLETAAIEKPDVAELIIATAKLLKK